MLNDKELDELIEEYFEQNLADRFSSRDEKEIKTYFKDFTKFYVYEEKN